MNGPYIAVQRFPHCEHCVRPRDMHTLQAVPCHRTHRTPCQLDPTCPGAVPVPDESETT